MSSNLERISSLLEAIQSGNLEEVKSLSNLDEEANYSVEIDGKTPLLLAIQLGRQDIVRWLVEQKNVDINYKREGDEASCLFQAIQYNRREISRYLLERGADPNAPKSTGFTPLLLAAQQGHLEILRWCVEFGGDLNYQLPSDKVTALLLATQEGYLDIVKWCIENGARMTNKANGLTVLGAAALNNQKETFSYFFLDLGIQDFSQEDLIHVLCFAAYQNNPALIRFVLEIDLSTIDKHNHTGKTAFMIAFSQGQEAAENELLIQGANPFAKLEFSRSYVPPFRYLDPRILSNNRSYTLMEQDMRDFAKEINSGDRDPFRRSPIFTAARLGRVNWLNLLMENSYCKAQIHYQDLVGWTPLHEAGHAGQVASVQALLKAGADPNAMNFNGQTPYDVCKIANEEFVDVCKLIEDSNGDIDVVYESHPEHRELIDLLKQNPDYSATMNLLKVKRSFDLGTQLKFAGLMFLVNLFLPVSIISGSLSRIPVTQIMLKIHELLSYTNRFFLPAFFLCAIMVAFPVYAMFISENPSLWPYLQYYSYFLSFLGFLYLLGISIKARNEPRFHRFKSVCDKFVLLPPKVNEGDLKVSPKRLKQLKKQARARAISSYIALFALFLEFFQQSAFSFVSTDFGMQGPSRYVVPSFRISLLDFSKIVSFSHLQSIQISVVGILIFIWMMYSSAIGTGIFILRSGERIPNISDSSQQPYLRLAFPFIDSDFFTDIPGSETVVPIVTNALFVWIIGTIFRPLDCNYDQNLEKFFQLSFGPSSVQCYVGSHRFYFIFAVLGLLFYLPSSITVGLFYLDSKADIKFIGQFMLYERCLKLIALAILNFFGDSPIAVLFISFAVNAILLSSVILTMPCFSFRSINIFRAGSLTCATWSLFIAIIAIFFNNNSVILEYTFFVGWICIFLVFTTMIYPNRSRFSFRKLPISGESELKRSKYFDQLRKHGIDQRGVPLNTLKSYFPEIYLSSSFLKKRGESSFETHAVEIKMLSD